MTRDQLIWTAMELLGVLHQLRLEASQGNSVDQGGFERILGSRLIQITGQRKDTGRGIGSGKGTRSVTDIGAGKGTGSTTGFGKGKDTAKGTGSTTGIFILPVEHGAVIDISVADTLIDTDSSEADPY